MKRLFPFSLLLITLGAHAQTTFTGTVQDTRGEAIVGANVYLKDTYDGTSSATNGSFTFVASATGEQWLLVSAVGYRSYEQPLTVRHDTIRTTIILREAINKMDGVTITAGAFAASDEKQGLMLKPLEIVTTAGALGDISGALNTLPGTQTVAEDGRLFVRGGDGHETQTYMDGMLIHAPYGASAPDVPTRGRFSPFLFKGTTFSTGGYSAEYGQALSSALILNSVNLAPQTQTDVSLMTVGVDATHQHRWENTSLLVRGEYTNLVPYQGLVKQDVAWECAPVSGGGSVALRHKTSAQGVLKLYGYANRGQLALRQPTISRDDSDNIRVQNDNLYLNGTYQEAFTDRWSVRTGLSYTQDQTATTINNQPLKESSTGVHTKATVTYDASEYLAIRGGAEHQLDKGVRSYQLAEGETVQRWDDQLSAGFVEADVYASSRWVARAGVRGEYSSLSQTIRVDPRLSLAYQTGSASQVSLAYGAFAQRPEARLLTGGHRLLPERATHYIANYQRSKNGRTFRVRSVSEVVP